VRKKERLGFFLAKVPASGAAYTDKSMSHKLFERLVSLLTKGQDLTELFDALELSTSLLSALSIPNSGTPHSARVSLFFSRLLFAKRLWFLPVTLKRLDFRELIVVDGA